MTPLPPPARLVETHPCQRICVWRPTGDVWLDARSQPLRVFACAGCGSEWVRTEGWTPADANGVVPPEVAAERSAG
jgi:hypothetical protein